MAKAALTKCYVHKMRLNKVVHVQEMPDRHSWHFCTSGVVDMAQAPSAGLQQLHLLLQTQVFKSLFQQGMQVFRWSKAERWAVSAFAASANVHIFCTKDMEMWLSDLWVPKPNQLGQGQMWGLASASHCQLFLVCGGSIDLPHQRWAVV